MRFEGNLLGIENPLPNLDEYVNVMSFWYDNLLGQIVSGVIVVSPLDGHPPFPHSMAQTPTTEMELFESSMSLRPRQLE